ncbi:hypothetical protein EVAR_40408_1 [Eumeta japonica]|uniref:Uncharacterized protein n=1 Tax=Eumeta variegata TaxID=151549 RepID=A0A4C1WCU4_EUMVA|nr:hypothetical protein EVAR_40408_1 [Eumeta japonica]
MKRKSDSKQRQPYTSIGSSVRENEIECEMKQNVCEIMRKKYDIDRTREEERVRVPMDLSTPPFYFPLTCSPSIRYIIPSQEAGNALVTPPALRVSRSDCKHLLSDVLPFTSNKRIAPSRADLIKGLKRTRPHVKGAPPCGYARAVFYEGN